MYSSQRKYCPQIKPHQEREREREREGGRENLGAVGDGESENSGKRARHLAR